MGIEDLLDLPRKELLAAAVDHLLEPADDLHVAGAVELPEVARAEPAVGGEELGVRRRILVVAEVDGRSERGDLALGAGRHVAPRFVDQPEPEAGGDGTHRPGHGLGVVLEPRVGVEARLEHPVELDQVAVHPRAKLTNGLDGARGAARDDHTQRAPVEPGEVGLVQHRDDRRGRRGNVRDALALAQLEGRPGAELVEQDRPRSGHQRLHQCEVAPVEAERKIDEEDLVRGDPHVSVQGAARRERGVVAVDHALRVAGRSRGERHPHDVVRPLAGARRGHGRRVLDQRVE